MQNLEKLYSISPDLAFIEIEKEIAELSRRLERLDVVLSDVKSAAALILTKQVAEDSCAPSVHLKKWRYDARFPSYAMANVYEVEFGENGAMRWVGPERTLSIALLLNRTVQYLITVKVFAFVSEEIQDKFRILIDNEKHIWLSTANNLFETIIPQDSRLRSQTKTQIDIGVDADVNPVFLVDDKRTFWFSVGSIEITPI